MTLADKIVVLRAGEVMQVGSPLELYHKPANQFVAGFLGSPKMNFLDVEVRGTSDGSVTVSSPALEPVAIPQAASEIAAQGRAILGVRPQFLHPGEHADRGHLHGNVRLVERLGTETVLNVELKSGGNIVIAIAGDNSFDLGSDILVVSSLARLISSRQAIGQREEGWPSADQWPGTVEPVLRGPRPRLPARESGLVLEGERHPRPERRDLSLLHLHVQLHHLGHPKIAQRATRRLNGNSPRLFPRLVADTDNLDDRGRAGARARHTGGHLPQLPVPRCVVARVEPAWKTFESFVDVVPPRRA
jgi:hypothetical protein